jgi:hypothetical protein
MLTPSFLLNSSSSEELLSEISSEDEGVRAALSKYGIALSVMLLCTGRSFPFLFFFGST